MKKSILNFGSQFSLIYLIPFLRFSTSTKSYLPNASYVTRLSCTWQFEIDCIRRTNEAYCKLRWVCRMWLNFIKLYFSKKIPHSILLVWDWFFYLNLLRSSRFESYNEFLINLLKSWNRIEVDQVFWFKFLNITWNFVLC